VADGMLETAVPDGMRLPDETAVPAAAVLFMVELEYWARAIPAKAATLKIWETIFADWVGITE
jgi:hypothetical protein